MPTSPYDVLAVPPDATAEHIRAAYRALARQYHPDRNPDNEAAQGMFVQVAQAYELLGDAEKRRKYDAVRKILEGGADNAPISNRGRVYPGTSASMSYTMSASASFYRAYRQPPQPSPVSGSGMGSFSPYTAAPQPIISSITQSAQKGSPTLYTANMIFSRQMLMQSNINVMNKYSPGQTITVPGTSITGIISQARALATPSGDIELELEIIV